jgi:hypothetical protein
MKFLITANTLSFTKSNCGCGIVSNKQRKKFFSRIKKKSKKLKKTKTNTLKQK